MHFCRFLSLSTQRNLPRFTSNIFVIRCDVAFFIFWGKKAILTVIQDSRKALSYFSFKPFWGNNKACTKTQVVQKCPLFINFHTVENVNGCGQVVKKSQNFANVVCERLLVGTFKYEFGFIKYISILLFINTRVLYVQYLIFGLLLFTATATWPPYGAASRSACHVAHV